MDQNDLDNRFTYHPPRGDKASRYEQLRAAARNFAEVINDLAPDGREKSLAITAAEQAVMWANAAVARAHGLNDCEMCPRPADPTVAMDRFPGIPVCSPECRQLYINMRVDG